MVQLRVVNDQVGLTGYRYGHAWICVRVFRETRQEVATVFLEYSSPDRTTSIIAITCSSRKIRNSALLFSLYSFFIKVFLLLCLLCQLGVEATVLNKLRDEYRVWVFLFIVLCATT